MSQVGRLWDIIEDWRDAMPFPPTYRQIALRLEVSQSTFDTWKNPIEVPARRNLLAIARLTGKPYQVVVQAAVDDTKLFDEADAERAAQAYRRGKSSGRAMRQAQDDAGILVDHPEMISFSRLIAVLRCDVPSGTRITPSIGELSPKQRKRVHAYEKRIVETIAWYIEAGSRLWFLFPVIKRLPIERLHGRPPSRPEVVAVRFSKFMDQSSVQGPRGPMVSDRLVPH